MWWQVHGSEMACLCFLTHGYLLTPVAGFFILVGKEALVRGGKIGAGRKKNGEQLLRDLEMEERSPVVWLHFQMTQTGEKKESQIFKAVHLFPWA